MSVFTEAEVEYLQGQRLGRLATVGSDGSPQNNPVGFRHDAEAGTIDIAGYNMGASRKFRNVRENGRVAFVVDDIASVTPWLVRGIEIRGHAEALAGQASIAKGTSNEIIRIHPRRIIAWGSTRRSEACRSGTSSRKKGTPRDHGDRVLRLWQPGVLHVIYIEKPLPTVAGRSGSS